MIRPALSPSRFLAAAALVMGAVLPGCVVSVATSGTCEYDGKVYSPGDSFPASDGCNSCGCQDDGSVACTLLACVSGCVWEGKSYSIGDSFPAGDGCNTCSCDGEDLVGCTLIDCQPTGCVYAGKAYEPGQSFPATDGCNTCSCGDDGSVGCTEIACACSPADEWWRRYVSTDPQKCQVLDFDCPPNTKGFENGCGCGCEQSATCPEWFDCEPPKPCDLQMIKDECPYSQVAL